MSEEPKTENTVDLSFFDGKTFALTGADTSMTFGGRYGGASALALELDGVVYVAIEDPADDYRSSLDRVLILPSGTKLSTPLPEPHQVLARAQDRGAYGSLADLIEFIDTKTGKTVARIGTDNSDDYYPCFVGDWDPTALAANQPAKSA